MKNTMLAAAASLLAWGSAAWANPAADLAKAQGCYSCHANAEKVVGPSFSAIAEKYKNEKDAVATLSASISNGARGKWGRIPMPPHPSIAAAEVKTLAEWVLSVRN